MHYYITDSLGLTVRTRDRAVYRSVARHIAKYEDDAIEFMLHDDGRFMLYDDYNRLTPKDLMIATSADLARIASRSSCPSETYLKAQKVMCAVNL